MKVHSVIRKGTDHDVFCEDFKVIEDSGRYFIGAVFDGCSGGNESHFASSLFGKIFKQILYNGSMSGNTIEDRVKDFMRKFVNKLFEAKVVLELEENDLVTTFIMLVYDKVHGEAVVITVGDGIIHCDGEIIELENTRFQHADSNYKNMPDYIAYDINELGLDKTYFDVWYDRHVNVNKFIDPQDISIATDGLLTFNTPLIDIDILDFLLINDKWMKNKIMLSKKVNILRTKHKTVHKDDISIIRIIPNFKEDDNSSSQEGQD